MRRVLTLMIADGHSDHHWCRGFRLTAQHGLDTRTGPSSESLPEVTMIGAMLASTRKPLVIGVLMIAPETILTAS